MVMIETNFKHTELGLIPHDWEVKVLSDVVDVFDGTHQTPTYVNHGVNFYSVENITNNEFVHTKFISEEEHKFLTRKRCIEKGDVLMTRIGSIGACKYIDWDVRASYYVSLALLKNKDKEHFSMQYLAYASESTAFKESVKLNSLQFAIPLKINLGEISKVQLLLPPSLEEQERIANSICKMDELLAAMNEQIAKKRLVKQGAMQQLLTGKSRLRGFCAEWKKSRLDELGFLTAGGTPSTFEASYWDGDINWLQSGAVQNCVISPKAVVRKITDEGLKNSAAYLIAPDSVLIAITGATCANIGYLPFESCANQSVVSIEPHEGVSAKFLYFMLLTQRLNILSNRGGSAQGGVTLKALKALEVTIPTSLDEQRAIAGTLSAMDEEIQALQEERDKYALVKQGMMQQLLTGKIRI